jgi:hypothetical protein
LFTDQQFQRAKNARQVYHALGTPSFQHFKTIVMSNQIRNLPVTLEDVNLAEKMFGPYNGALKGKTTRQKPALVVWDYIEVPKELIMNHNNATLCIDGIKSNGLHFMTTVSRDIMYCTAEWVPAQTSQAYRSVLDKVFPICSSAGIRIKTIHCDNKF